MFQLTDTGRLCCPAMDDSGFKALMSLADIDLGWRTNPNTEAVAQGVRQLVSELGVTPTPPDHLVVFPQQVHGADVRVIEDAVTRPLYGHFSYVPDCDGLITDRDDVVIASQYADCTPIVLVSQDRRIFGVVHSGWRGTLGRIASRAVSLIGETYGIPPFELKAYLWPGIAQEDFEVSADVAEQFLSEFQGVDSIPAFRRGEASLPTWIERRGEKYHIDTHAVNRFVLEALGVKVYADSQHSTYTDLRFHSHRRDKDRAGRMVLVVTKE